MDLRGVWCNGRAVVAVEGRVPLHHAVRSLDPEIPGPELVERRTGRLQLERLVGCEADSSVDLTSRDDRRVVARQQDHVHLRNVDPRLVEHGHRGRRDVDVVAEAAALEILQRLDLRLRVDRMWVGVAVRRHGCEVRTGRTGQDVVGCRADRRHLTSTRRDELLRRERAGVERDLQTQRFEVPELLRHEDFHDCRRRVVAEGRDVVDRPRGSVPLAARGGDEGRFGSAGSSARTGRGACQRGRSEGGKAPDDQSDKRDAGETRRAPGSSSNKTPDGHNRCLLTGFPRIFPPGARAPSLLQPAYGSQAVSSNAGGARLDGRPGGARSPAQAGARGGSSPRTRRGRRRALSGSAARAR